ncbi:hypothetical protein KY366_05490 [Candidatus Woesearchaeota archaeon]|nr:hypothetical protein [Candidatus Woesearchaeota archaeon]
MVFDKIKNVMAQAAANKANRKEERAIERAHDDFKKLENLKEKEKKLRELSKRIQTLKGRTEIGHELERIEYQISDTLKDMILAEKKESEIEGRELKKRAQLSSQIREIIRKLEEAIIKFEESGSSGLGTFGSKELDRIKVEVNKLKDTEIKWSTKDRVFLEPLYRSTFGIVDEFKGVIYRIEEKKMKKRFGSIADSKDIRDLKKALNKLKEFVGNI